MAEGLLRKYAQLNGIDFMIDSAGTSRWHQGEPPDPRAIACMKKFGLDISDLRARQIEESDFHNFDKILAMDNENLRNLLSLQKNIGTSYCQITLFSSLGQLQITDIPDPYYGDLTDFEHVYHLLNEGAEKIIHVIKNGRW